MKKQFFKQIFFWCIVIGLNASCTSITKLFPKEPRPFQKREFNSEQWKNGDYQTRGEMAEDLREVITYPNAWKKSADEVRRILGEPDKIGEADCCYTRHSEKVVIWLYNIEIENDYRVNKPEKKITSQALKLYFPNSPDNYLRAEIGDRTGEHSIRMPVVGTIKF